MATVRQRIGEHDVIELREPVESWSAGTRGAVVAVQGDWKLVEIADDYGAALDFLSVPESHLRLIAKQRR